MSSRLFWGCLGALGASTFLVSSAFAGDCDLPRVGVEVEKIEAMSTSGTKNGFVPLVAPADGSFVRYRKRHRKVTTDRSLSFIYDDTGIGENDGGMDDVFEDSIANYRWEETSHYGLVQYGTNPKVFADQEIADATTGTVEASGRHGFLPEDPGPSGSWNYSFVWENGAGWRPSPEYMLLPGDLLYGPGYSPPWVYDPDNFSNPYETVLKSTLSYDEDDEDKLDHGEGSYSHHEKVILTEPDTFDAALDRAAIMNPPAWQDVTQLGLKDQESYMSCATPQDSSVSGRVVKVDLVLRTCPGKYRIKFEVVSRAYDAPANTPWSEPYYIERTVEIGEHQEDGAARTSVTIPKKKCVRNKATGVVWAERLPDDHGGAGEAVCGMPKNNSVNMAWSLGFSETGEPLGAIELRRDTLGVIGAFRPSALYIAQYTNGEKLEPDYDSAGDFTLSTPSADIRTVTVSGFTGYYLRFYKPDGNWNQLLAEWKISASSNYYQMDIEQTVGGTGVHHVFVDNGGQTVLIKGNLVEDSVVDAGTYTNGGTVTRTRTLKRVGQVAPDSVTAETFQMGPTGPRMIQQILAPGTSYAQTSAWTYYTATDSATGALADRLALSTRPDGSWEKLEYEFVLNQQGQMVPTGKLRRTIRPWLDSLSTNTNLNAHAVEEFSSSAIDFDGNGTSANDGVTCRTRIKKILGQEVSRSYELRWADQVIVDNKPYERVWNIRAGSVGAAWNAPTNLVDKKLLKWGTDRLWRSINSDGLAEIVEETIGAYGDQIETHSRGVPSNDSDTFQIVDGTVDYTQRNGAGYLILQTSSDITGKALTYQKKAIFSPNANRRSDRPIGYSYLDGTQELEQYACCGKLVSFTDRDGVVETYDYDGLKRQTDVTRLGIRTHTEYDAAGLPVAITRYGADNTSVVVNRASYDLAGRRVWSKDAANNTTTYSYGVTSGGGRLVTITNPDGGTVVTSNLRDGQQFKNYGTAVERPTQMGYSVNAQGETVVQRNYLYDGGLTSSYDQQSFNILGQLTKERNRSALTTTHSYFYDTKGRVNKQVDRDGVVTLLGYDSLNNQSLVVIDVNRNGMIDYDGTDRITRTRHEVVKINTAMNGQSVERAYARTSTEIWQESDTSEANGTLTSVTSVSFDGTRSIATVVGEVDVDGGSYGYGVEDSTTRVVTRPTANTRVETRTDPNGVKTISTYVNGRLAEQTTKRGDGTDGASIVSSSTYQYDAHGRLWKETRLGQGTTTYSYYPTDLVQTLTTPDPGFAATPDQIDYNPQVTTYFYDPAGRVREQMRPDGSRSFTDYFPTGQVKKKWGAGAYPVEYSYDTSTSTYRYIRMTTWRGFVNDDGKATTTWQYYYDTNLLRSKTDEAGKAVTYTYTSAGRLKTRTWARGIVTAYNYNNAGDLYNIAYGDGGVTPSVTYGLNRLGRIASVTDAAGKLVYGSLSPIDPVDEAYESVAGSANLLAGRSVERRAYWDDNEWRARPFVGQITASGAYQVDYGYDNFSRLTTVTQGNASVRLGYAPNVGRLNGHVFKWFGADKLTISKNFDPLGRLSQIQGTNSSSESYQRAYRYNDVNLRTRIASEDGQQWHVDYDELDQVRQGVKKLANGTAIPGYDHGYVFDTIGNRVRTLINGRPSEYAADALNRIGSRDVLGVVDVVGKANSSAVVLVNDRIADRASSGEFYRPVLAENGQGPVLSSIKIQAVQGGTPPQVATVNRTALVPATPEVYSYDDDGNLLQDGQWNYVWDAENRLKSMTTRSDLASAIPSVNKELQFSYDAQGRRIRKLVKSGPPGALQVVADLRFLYDGWNLVGEYDALNFNAVVRSHAWGPDLSGSVQGAGGVGGLLWTNTYQGGLAAYAPSFDGNGNIARWLNLASGSFIGDREYGLFGEPLLAAGVSQLLPFAFSTKYLDGESEFYYYGLRYYNPSTGRWISRDPVNEQGSKLLRGSRGRMRMREESNLYAMVRNNPLSFVDPIGLESFACCGINSMNEGERRLRDRYVSAHDMMTSNGVIHGGVGNSSCHHVNSDVLERLSPIPKCWKCTLRHGGRMNLLNLYIIRDHWVVSCKAYNSKGEVMKELIFDYWENRPVEDPTHFESQYPVDLGSENGNATHTPCTGG